MVHELECPKCNHEFQIKDDYESGSCPNCNKFNYYWDFILDEDDEEIFRGYYWEDKY